MRRWKSIKNFCFYLVSQRRLRSISCLALLLTITSVSSAWAWPTDSQWIPIPKGGTGVLDDHLSGGKDGNNDATGGVNIVPYSGSTPAAYTYNDGTYVHYRLRLDAAPNTGGNGILSQFGWGIEIDTDQNAADYEWLIMCDGISSPEVVSLQQNTVKLGVGDPSDKAEVTIATWPMPGNHRILLAPTTTNGDADYFLDFRIAYAVFKNATGITDSTLIRYFIGSSRSTNNLTSNGADLLSGSDLFTMATDYITPFGNLPSGSSYYDGTVKFVTDLNGATQRYVGTPGETLYLRVDDLDLNSSSLPGGQITVLLTSPTGDSERITLNATGVAGKYTGSIPTAVTNSTGVLHILGGQTATVTYIDAIAANLAQSVPRTSSILMLTSGTDIALTKSVDLPTAGEGTMVTFTIRAFNNGPSTVTALTVTDLLPAGKLTYASHSGPGSYLPGTGVWTPGAIANGSSAVLTLRATVNAGTSGTVLTNTASITSSTPPDGYSANNNASANVTVGGTDLRITKLVDNPIPAAGGTVTYTIRATNLGPNSTGGIQVKDTLPAGVTYVSDSGGGNYNTGSGIWTVGTLSSGQTAQLNITVTVNPGMDGQGITNTASLWASTQPDTNPANNSASAAIKIGFTDLVLTKTATKVLPLPVGLPADTVAANTGETIQFTVTIRNNGPHRATGIMATDLLPVGLTYVSPAIASQGSYLAGTGHWTVGDLANGATATLAIRATINSGTAGQTLTNTAQITAVTQPDSSPGNESDDASVSVNGTDLAVVKTVTSPVPATPNPGDIASWMIVVTNNGPNQATGVAVTDILPAGITLTTHSASAGTSWDVSGGNPSWVWSIGTLNVGGQASLIFSTRVDAGTTGQTITNTAMITASNQADPESGNNVSSAKIAVAGTDLAISKTVNNPTPRVGDTIVYTVRVANNGPNNATGVAVTDLLPPELTYISHTGGSYTPATGLWNIGNLNSGANITLTINAQVNNGNNGLAITNIARISALTQGDPNLTNNSASAVVNVGSTNLAITKTVSNATPPVSGPFIYTVTVTNTGANQATNVEVEDVLPNTVTMSSSSQGTYSGGLWLVGTLNAGASATLQITASANAGTGGTTITNTARLQRLDQADTNAGDNSASVNITPTVVGNLSTSTKSAVDLNGGEILFGDILRYTITLRESSGKIAQNVRVTDNIRANVNSLSVVSIPAGATNSSTGNGTGLFNNGFLDVSGITVPANGSVSIVFDVSVYGANGSPIDNSAVVNNPAGIGGTATAPTLTIAASTLPGSGTKQLYLQASDSNTTPSIPQRLSRTPYTSELPFPAVRIREGDTPVRWDLNSPLQKNLSLDANARVILQIYDEDNAAHTLRMTLSHNNTAGTDRVVLTTQDFIINATVAVQQFTFNLLTPATTILAGRILELTIDNEPAAGGSRIYIKPYHNFTGATSRIELNSLTVINVDSIGYFSNVAYPGGVALTSVAQGETIRIRATVSDPFGSYDITSAKIEISRPDGTQMLSPTPDTMVMVNDSGLANKTYEYSYTVPAGAQAGNWTVTVTANEGSEGVKDSLISSFAVSTLPNIKIAKSVATNWDPYNGFSNPFAIPGGIVQYTLTITNEGFGTPDVDSILLTDPIPANTQLVVTDPVITVTNTPADTGLTVSYINPTSAGDDLYFSQDGTNFNYQPFADSNGADASITHLRINPKGVFKASDGVTNPSFTVTFRVRIK